jgi:8-oxo-dGTP diphosphatase
MIDVVGGLIVCRGRVLLTQRRPDKDFPFTWESPGGKVEGTESHHEALRRELLEECGIRTVGVTPAPVFVREFTTLVQREDRRHIRWLLFHVHEFTGVPRPQEGQGIGWFTDAEMGTMSLSPGNAKAFQIVCEALRWST